MNLFKKNRQRETASLLILYASQTGNAKTVAQQAFKFYKKNGLKPALHDVSDFTPEQLTEYKQVLMVVSTSGKGGPPPSAKKFFSEIESNAMPELQDINYSVCALGDSSYTLFCEAGKKVDYRLETLNAKRVYPRVDCDADFSDQAVEWIKGTYRQIAVLNNNG